MVARGGKAPLGSGEPTRATSNRVIFRDLKITVSRLRTYNLAGRHIHRFSSCGKLRIDAVSIGRDPLTQPCATQRRA
jgi:hypothetical protein